MMISRISAASSAISERDNLVAMKVARENELESRLQRRVDLHELITNRIEARRDDAREQESRINDRAIDREHYDRDHPASGTDAPEPLDIPVNAPAPQKLAAGGPQFDDVKKPENLEDLQDHQLEDRLKGTWIDAVV